MRAVWITGLPSSGKSTVCRHIARRGFTTHDFDDGLAGWYRRDTDERLDAAVRTDRSASWYGLHDWRVEFAELDSLIRKAEAQPVFFGGTVTNEAEIWRLFDVVVFLNADLHTLLSRLRLRSNDQFGSSDDEQSRLVVEHADAEERYGALGALAIDAGQPLPRVVDQILRAAGVSP